MMRRQEKTTRTTSVAVLLYTALYLLISIIESIQAQDILRHPQQSNVNNNNPLANIQLPPQLASLTPQQLHQLAQLRELQIQQQQQQQSNNNNPTSQSAPAPIGIEASPTAQPSVAPRGAQIPQPNELVGETNDRHDDGSYNEAGSEMEGAGTQDASGSQTNNGQAQGSAAGAAPTFEVNWNKCPQLEPSESEKNKKTQVITKCLQSAPIPQNLTRENVEAHREQIATCALRVEGWFDDQGNYKYDKAESEIRGKKLDQAIEGQVLKFHVACKEEASKKFPKDQNKLIDQVQFYQACMDYYISIVCEIEVSVDQ